MKNASFILILVNLLGHACVQPTKINELETAGNPVFEGWYADPEGIIYGDKYWIYPTYSALLMSRCSWMLFPLLIWYTGQNMKELLIPQK